MLGDQNMFKGHFHQKSFPTAHFPQKPQGFQKWDNIIALSKAIDKNGAIYTRNVISEAFMKNFGLYQVLDDQNVS